MTAYKKIGMIGGLSPESTATYYLHITRTYFERYGDHCCPEIVIYSVNLGNYQQWASENRWDLITEDLITAGRYLQRAGVDFGLIATNTVHKVFNGVQRMLDIPFIHILEPTVEKIQRMKIPSVGLLGTKTTMQEPFYRKMLLDNGIEALLPEAADQEMIHATIMEELVRGRFLESSRHSFLRVVDDLKARGAGGVILGCTEIPLLLQSVKVDLPLFDSAILHAEAALDRAVSR